jgi:D-glycero-D-manno-heptose 1,7-bisphosphate phosphatase
VVEENGGVIKVIPLVEGFSTSKLIKSIQKAAATPTPRAILIDRDGVINDHMRGGIKGGYVGYKEHFIFLPSVFDALKRLSKTDFKLIIITNQSGIARGYYSHADVKRLHNWLLSEFRKKGIRIDAVYFCPHHPDEKCNCRKPGIAMFEMAAKDFGLSLAKSWMIGDSSTDIIAGRSANTKTVKIGKPMDKKLKLEPDHYAKDLKQAVSIILKSEKL